MAYNKTIVGRHEEQDILKACVDSEKAEFIAVYGRRRVGKTYLIKQYFKNQFDFYTSGVYGLKNEDQLENFRQQLMVRGFCRPSDFVGKEKRQAHRLYRRVALARHAAFQFPQGA